MKTLFKIECSIVAYETKEEAEEYGWQHAGIHWEVLQLDESGDPDLTEVLCASGPYYAHQDFRDILEDMLNRIKREMEDLQDVAKEVRMKMKDKKVVPISSFLPVDYLLRGKRAPVFVPGLLLSMSRVTPYVTPAVLSVS